MRRQLAVSVKHSEQQGSRSGLTGAGFAAAITGMHRSAVSLDPEQVSAYEFSGLTDYQLGDFEGARTTCGARPNYWGTQWCLALTYQKMGRQADAQTALSKLQAMQGDAAAYQYSTIYAQWGDIPKALEYHQRNKSEATIILQHVPNPLEFGVVMTETDGRIKRFLEKPSRSLMLLRNFKTMMR